MSADRYQNDLLPWKWTWNPKMKVWKMISFFNGWCFRFHVNFPGCRYKTSYPSIYPPNPIDLKPWLWIIYDSVYGSLSLYDGSRCRENHKGKGHHLFPWNSSWFFLASKFMLCFPPCGWCCIVIMIKKQLSTKLLGKELLPRTWSSSLRLFGISRCVFLNETDLCRRFESYRLEGSNGW